jgi:hypothetical protein
MGYLIPLVEKCKLANGFIFSASSRPRFLGLKSKTSIRFSSMVIHIWLGI